MGVRGLWDLLAPTGDRVGIETLSGQRVAIDASIWLTQFVRAVRDTEAMTTVRNAHLLGIFRRCCKLLYYGIDAVFVFDGGVPALKRRTRERRRHLHNKQQARLRRAAERLLLAKLHASQTVAQTVGADQSAKKDLASESVGAEVSYRVPELKPSGHEGAERVQDVESGASNLISTKPLQENIDTLFGNEGVNEYEAATSKFGKDSPFLVGSDCDPRNDAEDGSSMDDLLIPDPELLDADAIVSLPVSMQREIIASIRRRLHSELVTCVEGSKQVRTPLDFSKLQMERFIRTSQIQMKLRKARNRASKETLTGRRLASDANREYVLIKNGLDIEKSEDSTRKEVSLNAKKTNAAVYIEANTSCTNAAVLRQTTAVSGTEWAQWISKGPRFVHEEPPLSQRKETGIRTTCLSDDLRSEANPDSKEALYTLAEDPPSASRITSIRETDEGSIQSDQRELESYENVVWDQVYVDELDGPQQPNTEDGLRSGRDCSSADEPPLEDCVMEYENSLLHGIPPSSPQTVNLKRNFSHSRVSEADSPGSDSVRGNGTVLESENAQRDWGNIASVTQTSTALHNALPEKEDLQEVRHTFSSLAPASRDSKSGSVVAPNPTALAMHAAVEAKSHRSVAIQQQQSTELAGLYPSSLVPESIPVTAFDLNQSPLSKRIPESYTADITNVVPAETLEKASIPHRSNENDEEWLHGDEQAAFIDLSVEDDSTSRSRVPNENPNSPNAEVSKAEQTAEGMKAFLGRRTENVGPLFKDSEHTDLARLRSEYQAAAKQVDSVTAQMFADTKHLLQLLGIPFIEAFMEAEAQCAFLNRTGVVDAVVTEDSDAFLFGARCVYRHIFEDSKYLEAYEMEKIERNMGLTRDKLICLGLLLGSDYSDGVYGVGIVNATEIVESFCREPDSDSAEEIADRQPFQGLEEFREWLEALHIDDSSAAVEDPDPRRAAFKRLHINMKRNWNLLDKSFPNRHVIEAFLRPQVDLSWSRRRGDLFPNRGPDLNGLQTFCHDLFGWDSAKLRQVVYPVVQAFERHRERQTRIDSFFRPHRFARIRSSRLQRAVRNMVYRGIPKHSDSGNGDPHALEEQNVGFCAAQDEDRDNDALVLLAETEELMMPPTMRQRKQSPSRRVAHPNTKRRRVPNRGRGSKSLL
ncbi:hypothetical protein CCYA_CCYA06G1758 [Cyanidiococcus yangmingshanensis]|nr:hypothetical protein CCYA_CCYA06G1758 [Cyanidiococcus yangmingshanensis]